MSQLTSGALEDALIFVGGRDLEPSSGRWFDDLDPATGQVLARVACGTAAEIDSAVSSARSAQPSWAQRSPRERGRVLIRLGLLIMRDEEELTRLESLDTGKPLREARADVHSSANYFTFFGEAVDKIYGEHIQLPGGFAFVERIALGVTGLIIPWNFPMTIMARGAAPSLAAGNACVVKPAEEAPLSTVRLARLAIEAGLPPGVLNVVPGTGEDAGAHLAAHPDLGHLSFTGSRSVGKAVMHASAENTRPVLLELGGKSPSIVFGDSDLDAVIPTLAFAATVHAGQVCSSGTRVIVERAIYSELVDALAERLDAMQVGPGVENADVGPVVSQRQLERVLGYIAAGKEEGAQLVAGGARAAERPDGFFVRPTLFAGATPDMRIAREEIFGPVLTVIPFDDEPDSAVLANSTEYGLVAAVWTKDLDRAFAVSRRVEAGQVFINNWGLGYGIDLPFGGVRGSGFGREKGIQALHEYSSSKATVVSVRDDRFRISDDDPAVAGKAPGSGYGDVYGVTL